MKLFKKLKLVFSYGNELEVLLIKLRKDREEVRQKATLQHLNLCPKHRQRESNLLYVSDQCDYCNLQRELSNIRSEKRRGV